MDMPRRDLWAARLPGQVFVVELHSKPISDGPGLVFSGLIPDFDHFKGSGGGRTLPFLHPDGTFNLAPGLPAALFDALGVPVAERDVLAYIAATVAHPGYTATFADELTTPGVRVPLTADPDLWVEAVRLGEQVIWLHSYGAAFTHARPFADIRYPAGDPRQPRALTAISTMPEVMTYDEARAALMLGDGEFGPVSPQVYGYTVGGRNVLKSWFDYRKKEPGGRRSGSALDRIIPAEWDPDWTTEAIDLLTVLTRLVDLEPKQSHLLTRIRAAPTLTVSDLQTGGVRLPLASADRKARYPQAWTEPAGGPEQGTLV
jgi:hypothetical protein